MLIARSCRSSVCRLADRLNDILRVIPRMFRSNESNSYIRRLETIPELRSTFLNLLDGITERYVVEDCGDDHELCRSNRAPAA
jgi:hypothetical protein